MSGISGVGNSFSSSSAVALQSKLNKLQSEYASCASCDTTPNGEKQLQEMKLGGEIQATKQEIAQINQTSAPLKIYELKNTTQQITEINSYDPLGARINLLV